MIRKSTFFGWRQSFLLLLLWLVVYLGDDNVRSGEEDRYRRHDREEREGDEAESIENHGSKFPVVFDGSGVLVVADLVRDHPQLLQDEVQFTVYAWEPENWKTFLTATDTVPLFLIASTS